MIEWGFTLVERVLCGSSEEVRRNKGVGTGLRANE
jgi:hypothetical protein